MVKSSLIEVAKNETRDFFGSELDNGIKYVNISDKTLDKSSLIVSVNVGSIAESKELQGLAHFLEHMLFLGSKKYPNESYFDEFLSKNGGYSNAYTDTYQTVYYFQVLNDSFEKSIDIISRFFIDPLFDKGSVDREINAIESEHLKNIQSDLWRYSYFTDLISKKDSMINMFSTGNLETLKKPNVRDEMIKFYKKYYISSNIKISSISSIPNSEVSKLIQKYFGQIKKCTVNESMNGNVRDLKPYYNLGKEAFYLQTINEVHFLSYLWEIPAFNDYYLINLAPHFIGDIIDSENENSLNNFLIKKGLIKGVRARVEDEGKFNVIFDITDLKYWREVDSYFRYFMSELEKINFKKICEYQISRDKLLFNIGTKRDSLDLALKIANNLHYFNIEKVNVGSIYPIKLDLNKVDELVKCKGNENKCFLNFDNVKIILCSSVDREKIQKIQNIGLKVTKFGDREPYYGLKWASLDISRFPENKKEFNLKIEDSNPYLNINPTVDKSIKLVSKSKLEEPKKFLLKLVNKNQENRIDTKCGNEIWFGNSYEFNEAIIYSTQIFTNIDFVGSLENLIFVKIFIQYLNYKIGLKFNLENELGFVSGLSFNISHSKIELGISGWNEKYEDFFGSIMKFINNFSFDPTDEMILKTLFKSMEEENLKISKENPWQFSDYIFSLKTIDNRYDYSETLKYLKSNSGELNKKFSDKFESMKKMIFNESNYKFFLYGNTSQDILKDSRMHSFSSYYFKNCKKCILNKSTIFTKDIAMIHPNKDEKNNCFSYYYFISGFSIKKIAMLILFQSSIQQKFYDSLRTKQQFGYLVKTSIVKTNTEYYLIQKIQSERSLSDIKKAIDKFNQEFVTSFKEEGFDKLKKSVHDDLKEPDSSTLDTSSKFLSEISNNTYLFGRSHLLADYLIKIKFTDFSFFLKQFLFDMKKVTLSVRKNEN